MSRFDRPSGPLRLYTLPNGRVSAFLSAFLLLTLVSVSVAQETDVPPTLNFHRWGSVTVFNGLPSDAVRAISQTQDGVMWFGTDNGVARFDGRRVQTFAFDDPESNRIVTLKTDAEGNLWVGTHNGAFVYSAHGFQPVAGTENLTAACLLFGDETLIGTGQGFIMRVGTRRDGSRYAERISPGTIANSDGEPLIITSLIRDGARLIAATAGRGLMAFKDGRFAEVASASANVNAAVTAKDGRIWFGRDASKGTSGVYVLSGGKAEMVAAPTAMTFALAADDSGIWAGTARYGLFHFTGGKQGESFTLENTSGGLRSNTIFAIFPDREGVVWVGTNRGVSRYDPLGPLQETVSDSPNRNFVRSLFHYGEGYDIYAGTNRGLFREKGTGWEQIRGVGDRPIYAIDCSSGDPRDLFVATPQGVFDVSGNLIVEGDTRSLNQFNGRMYAAVFGKGVFDLSDKTRPRLVYANESVTSLGGYVGKMLIGTAGNGLFGFDGTNVTVEATADQLKSGTIWKIWQAGYQSSVWIAGQHGVFLLKSGSIEQVLAVQDVRDVWVASPDSDDHVWAATTSRGLLHARRHSRWGWMVASIGFEQGLPSDKAFSILPGKYTFLIATNRGIVDLGSRAAVEPKLIPIRVLSQRLHDFSELTSPISLEYPQNSLLVEVAGQSSRTFPEEFQYSFLLKDAKGEAVDSRLSGDPQYAPADLRPGEYAIEAVAFNRDLLASEPLVIRFSVAKAPFPWTATALGILLAIALVGLVWAAYEHRRIKLRNRELKAARFDLANEAERERSRIARDLHDQTLADLRNLMMRSDKGEMRGGEFREEIEAVSTEIRRICEDLSPSVLENVGLIASLEFLLSGTIESHLFAAEPGVEDAIDFPVNVQLQIYRIVQEVLTNIKKHSDAATVEIAVEGPKDENTLKLSVKDDGTFFEPNGTVTGRGIANIRARANLIGAKVAWKRRRSGGNAFSLTIKPR